VKHPEIARFLGKRVRVYHRSGDVFTGYLQLAEDRLLGALRASGHIEGRRVYEVQSSGAHPEVQQTHYMIADPGAIERIELI
jgi:hypothetical protein